MCAQTLRLLREDPKTSGDLHEYCYPETGYPVVSPVFPNWDMLVANRGQGLDGGDSVWILGCPQ